MPGQVRMVLYKVDRCSIQAKMLPKPAPRGPFIFSISPNRLHHGIDGSIAMEPCSDREPHRLSEFLKHDLSGRLAPYRAQ